MAGGARAVASMTKVALVSLEPASPELNGVQVMARALDAVARANVEVLLLSSSSYRQNFCFLVREEELAKTLEALESALALELAHDYLKPIHVDRDVGLLAAVGEGMQGKPGLAGRIFTAISRAHVNVIAIAQGSSELTIAVVVAAIRPGKRGARGTCRVRYGPCGRPRRCFRTGPRRISRRDRCALPHALCVGLGPDLGRSAPHQRRHPRSQPHLLAQ